jgi:hypothetical protein
MRREDFYLAAVPVFATYLGVVSGNEALKYTALNTAELDEEESRRLFVASLMPSPSALFLEDRLEVARHFGYALAQEEAGVDRSILVHSFLESSRSVAVSRLEARLRIYESLVNALGALFLLPLFLLFMWAVGVLSIEPTYLLLLILGVTASTGAAAVATTPKDLSLWKTYEWSLPLGALAATVVGLLASPVASFLAFGAATTAWLKAKDRLWWFRIRQEVPPMLRAAAAMLKEGAPPDLIVARLSGRFRVAAKIAYGYFVPSKYFVLAKSMYRAIVEAGGAAAVKAVEYIQTVVDMENVAVKKTVKLSAAYFALFIAAVGILAYSVSTAAKALSSLEAGYNPFFSPPPYEEIRRVVSTAMSLIAASYIAIFLSALGIHHSTTLGGAVGLALQQGLQLLL